MGEVGVARVLVHEFAILASIIVLCVLADFLKDRFKSHKFDDTFLFGVWITLIWILLGAHEAARLLCLRLLDAVILPLSLIVLAGGLLATLKIYPSKPKFLCLLAILLSGYFLLRI